MSKSCLPPHARIVTLGPGDFYFGKGATRIATLLGSCVSITLWHPRLHYGGMCHYMLSERTGPATGALDGRYAAEAFEMFLAAIRNAGTAPTEYQAKLFGGGDMFSGSGGNLPDVGRKNVLYGEQLIAKYHIDLVSHHVGGNGRRKLYFDLWSGNVWLAFPQGVGAKAERR